MKNEFSFIFLIPIMAIVAIGCLLGMTIYSILVPTYLEIDSEVVNVKYSEGSGLFGGNDKYLIYFEDGTMVDIYEAKVDVPRLFKIGRSYKVKFQDVEGMGWLVKEHLER